VIPRRQRGGVTCARPAWPDARHDGNALPPLGASRKPQGAGPGQAAPGGVGRMAEGRAGGAAGLFAKQVQKKFSRAQEKVGGWEPRLRPDAAAGCAGCSGRETWLDTKADLGKGEQGFP